MTEEQLDKLVSEFRDDLVAGCETPKINRVIKNGLKALSEEELEKALERSKAEKYPIFKGE